MKLPSFPSFLWSVLFSREGMIAATVVAVLVVTTFHQLLQGNYFLAGAVVVLLFVTIYWIVRILISAYMIALLILSFIGAVFGIQFE